VWRSLLLLILVTSSSHAQTPVETLRITRDDAGAPLALQTSIVSFRDRLEPESVRVDLVSAIHIADGAYFATLNDRFREYDSVLYELVAAEGANVPKGATGADAVTRMQVGMTRLLGLSFQLDEIDYTPANFVHADLSPAEMSRRMQERGESVYQYLWRAVLASLTEASRESSSVQGTALLAALFSDERERLLKVQFAVSMLDMDTVVAALEGENGSTLVGERNKRALDVLDERIEMGEHRIAIFYGAGHIADMARRIESEHGLVQAEVEWVDAWDLR
jgi:hypothetical protein